MRLKTISTGFIFLLFCMGLSAQQQVIRLWPGVAPGSENWKQKEVLYLNNKGQQMIRNVVTPTITVYLPDPAKANGTAMVVAPGGGFMFLSWQTEGTEVAQWLTSKGITVFLLKYRLRDTGTDEEFQKGSQAFMRQVGNGDIPSTNARPAGNTPLPNAQRSANSGTENPMAAISPLGQEDGRQAIRIIRQRASEWNINPGRIGIMGFSAGGMVTLGPVLQHDAQSRPDFAAPIYTPYYGEKAPEDAPPLFILVAADDALTSTGSVEMYKVWKAAGKEAELHVYSRGGHGFGMQKQNMPVDTWIERFGDWLKLQGLMK